MQKNSFIGSFKGKKWISTARSRQWIPGIALAMLLSAFNTFAQDSIQISGLLQNNTRFATIVIEQFGVGSQAIATLPIDAKTGYFSISAPDDIEPGVYRLRYSQMGMHEYVDVIVNGKEKHIHFELDVLPEVTDRVPFFIKSQANSQWYAWLAYERDALLRIGLMGQLLTNWPGTLDGFYRVVGAARLDSIAAYENNRNSFISNPTHDPLAVAMVQNKPQFFADPRDDWRLQDFYRRMQYWQKLQTDRPELINTPLFTDHIINYVRYYMNPEMEFSEAEMTKGFKISVDTIMTRFSGHEATYDFALRYLQLGFKEIGMEEVLQYIDQTYATEQCTEGMEDEALQQRLRGYEAMKTGSTAPEIVWAQEDGSLAGLHNIDAENVLVVFWTSWCPHCMEMMPKLNAWTLNKQNLQVLAISLDQDAGAYLEAGHKLGNMLHYNDFQGWESKPANDYFVYGTPTFVLVDSKRKIILKSASLDQIKEYYGLHW